MRPVMPDAVVGLMAPEIERIKALGFTALVECSTVGVGRRADLDRAVSEATDFPILVPTGIYREPWVPPFGHEWSEDRLVDWMLSELDGEIEGSGVRAGWIKLSAGDDGLTATETKILRAAARAGAKTNAVIGSHTIKGRVVLEQLSIIEAAGYSPTRFISIHTQAEPDFSLHLEIARRGAFIEYDWIGVHGSDESYVENINRVLDAGFGDAAASQPGPRLVRPRATLRRHAEAIYLSQRGLSAEACGERGRREDDRYVDEGKPVSGICTLGPRERPSAAAQRSALPDGNRLPRHAAL